MPEILTNTTLYIEDFLDEKGFDEGQSSKFGWLHRDKAIEILNKHLSGTEIEAQEYDGNFGERNNCRILLIYNDKEVKEPEDIGDYWRPKYWKELFAGNEEKAKKVSKAIEKADLEFDEAVLDDLSRVLNTPEEDLPLLIGKLTNDRAKRIYERLLKGAFNG